MPCKIKIIPAATVLVLCAAISYGQPEEKQPGKAAAEKAKSVEKASAAGAENKSGPAGNRPAQSQDQPQTARIIGFQDKDNDGRNDLFRDVNGDGVNDINNQPYPH